MLGHVLGHCVQICEVGSIILILKLQNQRLGPNNLLGVMKLFHARAGFEPASPQLWSSCAGTPLDLPAPEGRVGLSGLFFWCPRDRDAPALPQGRLHRAPERVRRHPPHFHISLGGRADQEDDGAPAGSSEITGASAAGQLEGAESAALATGLVVAASSWAWQVWGPEGGPARNGWLFWWILYGIIEVHRKV